MRKKQLAEVIVRNIGTVYSGNDRAEAMRTYLAYRQQSQDGYGRAGHESVTCLIHGVIEAEYNPTREEEV